MRFKTAVLDRIFYFRKFIGTDAGLYMLEGISCTLAFNIVSNNNLLFMLRLGASDYNLGMIHLVPQALNMLILLPGGIIADSLSNKKNMVVISVGLMAFFYIVTMFSPYLGAMGIVWFLAGLSLSSGMFTLYNISWQSFFPEVIPPRERNRTLTVRATWRLIPAILIPLITGFILASINENGAKISAHQSFYMVSAFFAAVQIFILRKIKPKAPSPAAGINLDNLKKAASMLAKNKRFLFFAPS